MTPKLLKNSCLFPVFLARGRALISLLIFFLFSPSLLLGQHFRFSSAGNQGGAELSNISQIVQDSSGFLWWGSNIGHGLFRFDGHSIEKHHPGDLFRQVPIGNIMYIVPTGEVGTFVINNWEKIFYLNAFENNYRELLLTKPHPKSKLGRIYCDEEGSLWVRSSNFKRDSLHNLHYLYKSIDHQQFELIDSFALKPFNPFRISLQSKRVFISADQSILELDLAGTLVKEYKFPGINIDNHFVEENGTVWAIANTKNNLNTDSTGIYYWEVGAKTFKKLPIRDKNIKEHAKRIYVDSDDIMILGRRFAVFNKKSGTLIDYTAQLLALRNKNQTSPNLSVGSVFKDRSGTFWLSESAGLVKMERTTNIEHYLTGASDCDGFLCSVRGITEDESGNIYFAANPGIFGIDPKTDSIWFLDSSYQVGPSPFGLTIHQNDFYIDNIRINRDSRERTFFWKNKHIKASHHLDQQNNIWISSGPLNAITVKNLSTGNETLIDHTLKKSKLIVPRQKENAYWVLTIGGGLILLNEDYEIEKHYTFDLKHENGLPSRQIYAGAEDVAGNLWIGSNIGLTKLDSKTETFIHYSTSHKPTSAMIYNMFMEGDQGIWLGTSKGLSFFDFANTSFTNYSEKDGFHNLEYNRHSAFKSKSGKLYFGGTNGIDAFYPRDLLQPSFDYSLPLMLTAYRYFDGTQTAIIDQKQGLNKLKKILLKPKDRFFELRFRLGDYRSMAHTKYSYKLINYDEDWSKPSEENQVRFENLPPGRYRLRVKASLSPTIWNGKEIDIEVIKRQFWYKTDLAYVIYCLVALGILLAFRRYEENRLLAKTEALRLQELDTLKTKMYTNITHEFRTPLTVIQGMADQIEKHPIEAKKMIRRNSENLLHLVNQMLDMSKFESGKMELKLVSRNIVSYLQYLVESFQSFAASRNIQLNFHSEIYELIMDYDPEKVQHIMVNLLSNAIKFTQEEGVVDVHLTKSPRSFKPYDQSFLKIQIKDNGMGIKEADLPHIFDRFFQVDDSYTRRTDGTGIGLSLTKELVQLMGGSISAKSQWTAGTKFTILLPINQTLLQEEKTLKSYESISPSPELSTSIVEKPILTSQNLKANSNHSDLPLLLIIEDNIDVTTYIQTCLEGAYNTHTAYDGKQGIKQALELVPDIIISDVMMPEKNGFEVTAFLKNDERTSHIPIILLTAKADVESKLEGLTRGADVYLSKPFERKELLIRLEKLVELRQKLQARYSSLRPAKPSSQIGIQLEDAFLKKVQDAVDNRLDDAQFSVVELCKTLAISQSQLFRKIKALTGRSIAGYIRLIRLHRGFELLQTTEMNVSEVAYEVGFTDPNYFSKSFSKEFGSPPSEFNK